MSRTDQSSDQVSAKTGAAAAPARSADKLSFESALSQATTPEAFCAEVANAFSVRPTEVALLRLEKGLLTFIFPHELKTAGSIPISSSSAVAVHTVLTRKVELFNNFVKVKHVSVFETVKFTASEEPGPVEPAPIQKLMSAPITNADHKVLGILQVCRKAADLKMAGRDFTLDDLQQLESAAKVASKLLFMTTALPQQ
ncbi:MAG: hypothetical protein ACHP8A_04660 [Terriglobales bacterium]|jgi:hypothetical protein|nr:hypothetical protein [Terriglobales bacterium]